MVLASIKVQGKPKRTTSEYCRGFNECVVEAATSHQMALLPRSTGVHVDLHAHWHFHDLRGFPSHWRLQSVGRDIAPLKT